MRDIRHDGGEERASRSRNNRPMKRRVAHARRDRKFVPLDSKTIKTGDRIDVDQMRRPRHAERHHRHQTLAAGKDAAVERSQFRQLRYRLVDGFRSVINKRRWFHYERSGSI